MRGNHDNGMCFQTMQLIAVAVAMVFVLRDGGDYRSTCKGGRWQLYAAKQLCNGAKGGLWCDMF